MQHPARSGTAFSTSCSGDLDSSAGEARTPPASQPATQPAPRRPQKRRRGPRAESNGVPKECGQRRNRQGGQRRNLQGVKGHLGQQHWLSLKSAIWRRTHSSLARRTHRVPSRHARSRFTLLLGMLFYCSVNYLAVGFALVFLFVRIFLLGMPFYFFFIQLHVGVLTLAGAGSRYLTAAEIDTAGDASMQLTTDAGEPDTGPRAQAGSTRQAAPKSFDRWCWHAAQSKR